jgi:hypothetical protein
MNRLEILKNAMRREDVVMLGEKRVKIEKLTPAKWRGLFGTIGTLPQLMANVFNAPAEDRAIFLQTAAEVGLDDLLAVTSELTGIELDYLENKVSLTEVIEYITRTAKYNDLERAVKNVLSLLPTE